MNNNEQHVIYSYNARKVLKYIFPDDMSTLWKKLININIKPKYFSITLCTINERECTLPQFINQYLKESNESFKSFVPESS